ncbi:hypothetical protein [Xenorhabdus kozodoii]|nr:hypothetical protein [Xenorhabdus kozodoii]
MSEILIPLQQWHGRKNRRSGVKSASGVLGSAVNAHWKKRVVTD